MGKTGCPYGLRWMVLAHQRLFLEVCTALAVAFHFWKQSLVAERSWLLVPCGREFPPTVQKGRFKAFSLRRQSLPETQSPPPDRLRAPHPRAGSRFEEPRIPPNALCRIRNVRPSNNDLKHEILPTFTIWPGFAPRLQESRRGPLGPGKF